MAQTLTQNQRTKFQITLTTPDYDLSLATGVDLVVTGKDAAGVQTRAETWAGSIVAGATATTLVVEYFPLGVAVGGVLTADEVLTIRAEPTGPYGAGGASTNLRGFRPFSTTVVAERGSV